MAFRGFSKIGIPKALQYRASQGDQLEERTALTQMIKVRCVVTLSHSFIVKETRKVNFYRR